LEAGTFVIGATRATAVFGADKLTTAARTLLREADDGFAGVGSIEIGQKSFRVGRMNHNVPIAMEYNGRARRSRFFAGSGAGISATAHC
jgi:hypothetical protein